MNNLFTLDRKGENNGGQVIWSEDQLSYLVTHYNSNHSIPVLANQFNVSGECIRSALRKRGVKILSLSELHTLDFPRDSCFFQEINTPEKAYWLGFLMADGSVDKKNRITLSVQQDDIGHLQKFKEAIKATNNNIHIVEKETEDKTFYQACFSIRDNKMHSDLISQGCINNKTYIMQFPDEKQVPNELLSHYLRGYFDGDGSLYWTQCGNARTPKWRIGFTCGSKEFLVGIRHVFKKDNVAIEDRDSYFMLQISGNKQLVPILEYLYKDSNSSIWLDRKKQIYEKFLLQSIGSEPTNVGCE